jgi:outer membrane protein OmpA-like peptidoglycan-associated protein
VKPRTLLASATLWAFGTTLGCAPEPPAGAEAKPNAVAESAPSAAPAPASAIAQPADAAGGYLDGQARELDLIPGADVQRRPDALVLTLQSEALFEGSSRALSAQGSERIRALAHTLAHYPKQQIIVKGHTDNESPERSSQSASEDRADSVRNLLVAEGVTPSRITAIGLGASLPVASNTTEEGRQKNRRLEIELRPDEEALAGAPSP